MLNPSSCVPIPRNVLIYLTKNYYVPYMFHPV